MTPSEIAELLRRKGWTVEERDGGGEVKYAARLRVDLTRSITDTSSSLIERALDVFPDLIVTPTYARWELDVNARRARLHMPDDGLADAPGEASFEEAVALDVQDVGRMPLELLVEGEPARDRVPYDLMRAERDWACDLHSIAAGEYLVRLTSTHDAIGTEVFYRVDSATASRIAALDAEDAYREMERVVRRMEVEGRA